MPLSVGLVRAFGGAPCTVRKVGYLDMFTLMAKVAVVTTMFPYTALPQTPTQSKNSDNGCKQTMFLFSH